MRVGGVRWLAFFCADFVGTICPHEIQKKSGFARAGRQGINFKAPRSVASCVLDKIENQISVEKQQLGEVVRRDVARA